MKCRSRTEGGEEGGGGGGVKGSREDEGRPRSGTASHKWTVLGLLLASQGAAKHSHTDKVSPGSGFRREQPSDTGCRS